MFLVIWWVRSDSRSIMKEREVNQEMGKIGKGNTVSGKIKVVVVNNLSGIIEEITDNVEIRVEMVSVDWEHVNFRYVVMVLYLVFKIVPDVSKSLNKDYRNYIVSFKVWVHRALKDRTFSFEEVGIISEDVIISIFHRKIVVQNIITLVKDISEDCKIINNLVALVHIDQNSRKVLISILVSLNNNEVSNLVDVL